MDYTAFLKDVLTQAAAIAKMNFGKVSATTKEGDNNQVLTVTDKEIGQMIMQRIQQTYPQDNIIDEEAGVIDKKGKNTWVIDPIDGTSNFANGIPTFGIYLGMLIENTPVAGGIALPYFNDLYIAQKGLGTMKNGQKISVTPETNLANALVAYQIDGHPESPELTKVEGAIMADVVLHIRNLRTSNSAFDGAMVAEGKYGAVLNATSKIWDNVAQQVVIEEAGGVYTDFDGEPMDYTDVLTKANDNFSYCAGARELHRQIEIIIRQEEEEKNKLPPVQPPQL